MNKPEIVKIIAKVCRDIGKKIENIKARITTLSDIERKKNINKIYLVLNKLIIK